MVPWKADGVLGPQGVRGSVMGQRTLPSWAGGEAA